MSHLIYRLFEADSERESSIESFIVTRYEKYIKKTPNKRGRWFAGGALL